MPLNPRTNCSTQSLSPHRRLLRKQSGIAILLFTVLILLVGTSIFLGVVNRSPFLEQQRDISEDLADTKEALLTYAMFYPELYGQGAGRLPCPDLNGSGAPGDCSARIGRLPLQDNPGGSPFAFSSEFTGIDRQYWYAVSANFNANSSPVNTASVAELTLDGVGGYAAILIAPGEAINAQARRSNAVADYLEGGNGTDNDYIRGFGVDPNAFNDELIGITREELMSLSVVKVAEAIRDVLHDYHLDLLVVTLGDVLGLPGALGLPALPLSGDYPDGLVVTVLGLPVDIAESLIFNTVMTLFGPAWFTTDGWAAVTDYEFLSPNPPTIQFQNCNIVFTLEYDDNGTPLNTADDVSILNKSGNRC